MTVVIRYAVLPASRVFNLCSPRYLPEVMGPWRGKKPFHHERYEPVRDLMEKLYVEGFDAATGHYEKLAASIEREGIRNPILVAAGKLDRRKWVDLPPSERKPDVIACEWVGGSRLLVAQRLGIEVPLIVNDHTGVLSDAHVLPGLEEVARCFLDRPRTLRIAPHGGVYLNNLPYVHFAERERYGVTEQSRIRRGIVAKVKEGVRAWLKANDTA